MHVWDGKKLWDSGTAGTLQVSCVFAIFNPVPKDFGQLGHVGQRDTWDTRDTWRSRETDN